MFSKIVSKVLVDKGVLGGCREEVFLFVFLVLGLVGGDVGEDVETKDGSRGDGGTGDDIGGAVWDVEDGKIFDVVEGGPDRSRGWGITKLGGLRNNGLEDTGGNVKRTWIIPSVVRALKDLKDGGGSIHDVLLINVVKGRPGSNGDMGEGGGDDDGGLGRSK